MQGTRGDQRINEPAEEVLETPTPIRDWFLRPPYPGTLLTLVLVLLLVFGGVMLKHAPSTPPEPPEVAFSPAVVPSQQTQEHQLPEQKAAEEAPVVTIRPVPGKVAKPAIPQPDAKSQPSLDQAGNMPLDGLSLPSTRPALPGALPGSPDVPINPSEVPTEPTPAETPRAETPPLEVPEPARPEPVRPEPVRPEPPREEAPRPRPRRRVAPPVRVTRPMGRMTVFFDADSSTFDRHDERLPLRVQVYVDGQKRLESSDPEKREFDLGDLPEGQHEVVVVPYVGRNQPEPRRFRVDIGSEADNRFKAVLRREDGFSRISKFRPRD